MLEGLLEAALSAFVERGSLQVVTSRGRTFVVGRGGDPTVAIRFTDAAAERALLWDPDLKLGELFVDGRLVIERGSIYDLVQVLIQDSRGERSRYPLWALHHLRMLTRRWTERNTLRSASRNVAHHYDLDDRLYELFLDADRQYSCAYFESASQSLEDAQAAKKRHIAAKLLMGRESTVLDIGSGWGGLALYLAEIAGAKRVKGITLSQEQLAVSRRRAEQRGLGGTLDFAAEDYRHTAGTFDRIVSVGMFEHVGSPFYGTFFDVCSRRLADDGVMLLHTIGRTGGPEYTNPWIAKYIFPGGHLPILSEIAPAVERAGLVITDLEVLRLHYAETLRAWRERFMARRDEAARLYDERFCRMWECYLAMAEGAFRFLDLVVFQIQLAKRNDVVPLTRDYIAERTAELRQREEARGQFAAAAE